VVILASQERGGREFYAGSYNPEAITAPECWSNDGITPDATIKEPKSSKCATCPLSVKGSKQTDNGKDATACQVFRLLAVVPAHDLDFEPLRLKLRTTSNFDGRNKEAQAKGWFGFKNYEDILRSKGVRDTRALSTKLRFDSSAEYPKLQFSAGKWLTPEALDKAMALSKLPLITDLITAKYTARSDDAADKPGANPLPTDSDDEDGDEVVLAKPKTAQTAPSKPAAVTEVEEDDDDKAIRLAQEKKAAKVKAVEDALKLKAVEDALKLKAVEEAKAKQEADAKAKAAAKAAPVTDDDDADDAAIAAAIARKRAKEAAAKEAASKPAKPAAVEEVEDDAPPTTGRGKGGKAAPATAKPANVSPAVAGVLGKWAVDDDD
jgi:chemotaxis protein histidine kinase CheA